MDEANMRATIARIIDPIAFKAWQASYDYSMAQGDTDADAAAQADWSQKKACDEAFAKAGEILATFAHTIAEEARAEERERAARLCDDEREHLEAGHYVLVGWSVTQAKIRMLGQLAAAIRNQTTTGNNEEGV